MPTKRDNLVTDNLVVLILSLIILIIGLQITPGLSFDSTRYIAVAEKIITVGPFYPLTLHSNPLDSYATSVSPPLFEYLISGFLFLGFEKLTAGGMVSLLFLAFLPFPIFYLAKEAGNRNIGYLSVLCFIPMASTWYVGSYVWTETTFVFFSLSALFFSVKYLKYFQSEYLILCAFCNMISCLTKWVGIILVISIFTVIFYTYVIEKRSSKILLFVYLIISLLPASILLLKNFLFKGNIYTNPGSGSQISTFFFGSADTMSHDFIFPLLNTSPKFTNIYQIGRLTFYNKISEISSKNFNFNFNILDGFAIIFFNILDGITIIFLIISLILFISLTYYIFKLLSNFQSIKKRLLNERKIFIFPIIMYTILYPVCLIFLKSVYNFDDFDTRILFPIYPLLLIIFFYLYYEMVACLPESEKPQIMRYFSIMVIFFLIAQVMSSSVLLLQQRNGREYSSDEEKILTTHDSFIFLKNNWNRSDPIFTNVDVTSIKYYLDSYLNENVSEINENEILKSSDKRIILFIQTNKQNDTLEQILNISESHSMFIRCLKDEKYEVWVNKKFDNFCN